MERHVQGTVPNTAPPLPASPQYRRWFTSPKYIFSWLYMTPLTAVFQYRLFFASPESGGIGVVDCIKIVYKIIFGRNWDFKQLR